MLQFVRINTLSFSVAVATERLKEQVEAKVKAMERETEKKKQEDKQCL
jgi:hypothetical protein